jgi:hypothetical protein
MKKGCFIKLIVVLTILTAAVLYFVQNYFDRLILLPGKKILKSTLIENWDTNLKHVYDTPEKDSLKVLVNNFLMQIDLTDSLDETMIENFAVEFSRAIKDSLITNKEYNKLKNIITVEEDERSKKN